MPTPDFEETIVAIASASGPGWRGILRFSGPDTLPILHRAFDLPEDPRGLNRPTALDATLRWSAAPAPPLPGKLLVWPGNRSYTRQPSAEFHTLASPPLLDEAIHRLTELGCRQAEPGEFTLRAFLSGRIDLPQAEAVLAVIDADGPRQLQQALAQLAGGLTTPLMDVRERLLRILTELEAGLDFVEEDIEFVSGEEVRQALEAAGRRLEEVRQQLDSRGLREAAVTVALVGLPNAGKSSLFNSLLGESRAIVSEIQGTTRDTIAAQGELGGHPLVWLDTAGVDPNAIQSEIDSLAQQVATEMNRHASLRLVCIDGTRPIADSAAWIGSLDPTRDLIVLTKCDVPLESRQVKQIRDRLGELSQLPFDGPMVETSSLRNRGIDTLRDRLLERLRDSGPEQTGWVATTLQRTRGSLIAAATSLDQARQAAAGEWGTELIAADLRQALEALAEVVGKVYTDDLLDRIFRQFCIGK